MSDGPRLPTFLHVPNWSPGTVPGGRGVHWVQRGASSPGDSRTAPRRTSWSVIVSSENGEAIRFQSSVWSVEDLAARGEVFTGGPWADVSRPRPVRAVRPPPRSGCRPGRE